MKIKSRITSVLKAEYLDGLIPGVSSFDLSTLSLPPEIEFSLPTNLRLGHLVEKVVSQLIQSSDNYTLLYENLQIINDHKTIGEIDFILEDLKSNELIHLELAYKFYLYDPSISNSEINNWIGPNRKDSLIEKLEKLKTKQFPLLHHDLLKLKLAHLDFDKISQALCFLSSLFIPYDYKGSFNPIYQKAIKGYYLNFEQFIRLDHPSNKYHLPTKTEWGIDPKDNEIWTDFKGVEPSITNHIEQHQSVLCWQKSKETYLSFIIVWWLRNDIA